MLSLLDIVAQCSPWEGHSFDPRGHVRAVNMLCIHPEPEVRASLQEFARSVVQRNELVVGGTQLMFLLRLLFVPIEGIHFPEMNVGKPLDGAPPDPKDFPIYPLVLREDVPLLIVSGFFLRGLPADPMRHIESYTEQFAMRREPLRPPDNPLMLADELTSSPQWYRRDWAHDRGMLRAQLLRLVRNVYAVPGVDEPTFFASLSDEVWLEYLRTFTSKGATWDARENDYVV